MLTFTRATEMMKTARNGKRKLGNNTYLEKIDDNTFGVKLHATYVVKLNADGTYTLNSGGWQTVTTKARINEFSPARLYQGKGLWYVGAFLYEDGMTVKADGTPVKGKLPEATEKKKAKLDRLCREYVKGFAESVNGKGLTQPSGGDCWGCAFKKAETTSESELFGKSSHPTGDQPMGVDHILSHFKEKYYVPSLLWKALQRCGNPAVVWHMIDADAKRGRTDLLKRELRAYLGKLKPALLAAM